MRILSSSKKRFQQIVFGVIALSFILATSFASAQSLNPPSSEGDAHGQYSNIDEKQASSTIEQQRTTANETLFTSELSDNPQVPVGQEQEAEFSGDQQNEPIAEEELSVNIEIENPFLTSGFAVSNQLAGTYLQQIFGVDNIDTILQGYQRYHNLEIIPDETTVLKALYDRAAGPKDFTSYVRALRGYVFEVHVADEFGVSIDGLAKTTSYDGLIGKNQVQIKSGSSQINSFTKIRSIFLRLKGDNPRLILDQDGMNAILSKKALVKQLQAERLLLLDDAGNILPDSRIQASRSFKASTTDAFIQSLSKASSDIASQSKLYPIGQKIANNKLLVKANEAIEKLGALMLKIPGAKTVTGVVGNAVAKFTSFVQTQAPGLAKLLPTLGKVLGVLGAGLGVFFGAKQSIENGSRLRDLFAEGNAWSGEGLKAGLKTLSGALLAASGVLGAIGLIPGAQPALLPAAILAVASLAIDGTIFLVEKKEAIVEGLVSIGKAVGGGVSNIASSVSHWVVDKAVVAWEGVKSTIGAVGQTFEQATMKAKEYFDRFKDQLGVSWEEFKSGKVLPAIAATGVFVKKIVKVPYTVTKTVTRTVKEIVPKVVQAAKTVWKTGVRYVNKAVQVVTRLPRVVYDRVTTYVQERVKQTYQVAKTVYQNVSYKVREAYTVMKSVPRLVTTYVKDRVQQAYTYYENVRKTAYRWISQAYTTYVKKPILKAYYTYQTVWRRVATWVKGVWGWFKRWVTKPFTKLVQKFRTVYQTVRQVAYRRVKQAYTYFEQVARTGYKWVEKIRPVVKTVFDRVAQTAYRFVDKVKRVPKTVYQTVTNWVTRTKAVVKNVPRTVYDTVKKTVMKVVPETYRYKEVIPEVVQNVTVEKTITEQVKQTQYREEVQWVRK